jgi:hypothetical protein
MLFFLFFFEIRQSFRCFFDFCVCVPKIVQSYFSSQSFNPKIVQSFNSKIVQSFNSKIVQSFNSKIVQLFSRSATYIYIVEMGYFAAHSTWRHRVLYCTRYYVAQGAVWCKVGNFSLCLFYTFWDLLGPSAKIAHKYTKKILKYICVLNIYILSLYQQKHRSIRKRTRKTS